MRHRRQSSAEGSALIVTLLALALLFSLGVPYLFTSRLRSEASREGFDRARARIAVESAEAWAESVQLATHPALDPTPYYDSADEWDLSTVGILPQSLGGGGNAADSRGVRRSSPRRRASPWDRRLLCYGKTCCTLAS